MAKLRIAVAGAGLIGLRHIEETQRSKSARLSAIVDTAPGAAEVATREGVPLYKTLDELIAVDRPDGIVLATPNAVHVQQALQCVTAGIPVLVEKPIAHTLAEGKRLVETAERVGARLLVGHHRRHSPILQRAVETIRSGMLGPIVAVMGSAAFYKPQSYFEGANAWRTGPGGGPLLINMIHEVDNLRAMAGEIVAVQSFTSNAKRGFEVEDTVAINLRFETGALGTFLLSDSAASPRSWEQTSQENKDYATYPEEDAYVVIGTDGSLAIPTMRLNYYARKEDRSWYKPFAQMTVPIERVDPLSLQIEHFGAVIRGDAEPLVGGRDGLQNLRVTEAIAEAARSGRTVSVDVD